MILGPSFPKAKVMRTANSMSPPYGVVRLLRIWDAGDSAQEHARTMKMKKGICSKRVGRNGKEASRRDLRTLMRLVWTRHQF